MTLLIFNIEQVSGAFTSTPHSLFERTHYKIDNYKEKIFSLVIEISPNGGLKHPNYAETVIDI